MKETLRILGAAYEAANNYDSVPDAETAKNIPNELQTWFTPSEFEQAANKYEGYSPRNIVDEIIHEIGKLN